MMSDKLIQMQPTPEMVNSINGLNMLRSNLLPIQQDNQQSFPQQQNNTLEQYLATIQYLSKQQSAQLNQQNQNNLDTLLMQQHQLNQQLLNGQNNSNGNSPLSTQSISDHDNYVDVINNLPQQLLCFQQRKLMEQHQQIELNAIKNQAIQGKKQQQELLAKTLTNQLTNQINNHLNSQLNNQINDQLNNRLNHLNSDKFINYQQQPLNQQIIQHQSPEKYTPPEKYTSPLVQIAQMTVIDNKINNMKCAELNSQKCEQNKSSVDSKSSKPQSHFHNLASTKLSNNKRPIEKLDKHEMKHQSDQNNNSPKNSHHSMIGSDEQGKPFHNYIGLIAQAILKSKDGKLMLSDIYKYILENYPYYRTRSLGWRNSIRHNLSLNDCFQKGERAPNGKGHFWYIHPANVRDFQKGDFRRRRAQRKVRRHLGYNMLDNRLNDDDQDSEDEEIKKQFLSQFNQFQQLNLHNLQNFQTNLYHLNNLNNLNSSTPTLAIAQNQLNTNQNYPSIEGIGSSEEYLKYIAFLKRNWMSGLNPNGLMNTQFNSLEQISKANNLQAQQQIQQYNNTTDDNQLIKNSQVDQVLQSKDDKKVVVKEEKKLTKDEDDSEMVDIESETNVNKNNSLENEKKQSKDEDDSEMVDIESELTMDKNNLTEKVKTDCEMIEVDRLANEVSNTEVNKLKEANCEDDSISKVDKQNDKSIIDLDMIKKLFKNDSNYTPTQNNTRKHKFDMDSLLENEKKIKGK